jgi:hypothetical protein
LLKFYGDCFFVIEAIEGTGGSTCGLGHNALRLPFAKALCLGTVHITSLPSVWRLGNHVQVKRHNAQRRRVRRAKDVARKLEITGGQKKIAGPTHGPVYIMVIIWPLSLCVSPRVIGWSQGIFSFLLV